MCLCFNHPFGGSPYQCPDVAITKTVVNGTVVYNFVVTLHNTCAAATTAELTLWWADPGAHITSANAQALITQPGYGCGNETQTVGPLALPGGGSVSNPTQVQFIFSWIPPQALDAQAAVFIQATDMSNPTPPTWNPGDALNAQHSVPV